MPNSFAPRIKTSHFRGSGLLNELPNVDRQNKEIVGRLFPHGGLSEARLDEDGVMRDEIRIPEGQLMWNPAVIVMPRVGELEKKKWSQHMDWETPSFVTVKMDSEINSYQDDFRDGPEATEPAKETPIITARQE
jgi:hypothetical protein